MAVKIKFGKLYHTAICVEEFVVVWKSTLFFLKNSVAIVAINQMKNWFIKNLFTVQASENNLKYFA